MNKFDEAAAYKASFVPNVLYKFVSLGDDVAANEKKFTSLERGEIWFSSREAMNDPFEFAGIYIDEAKMRDDGWNSDGLARVKETFINLVFLASFTSNMSDNLPMWAHYANNHKGYCIKYKVKKKTRIYKVSYSRKRYPIAHGITRLLLNECMQDDDTIPTEKRESAKIEVRKCVEVLQNAYMIKHVSWEYENEFRVFCNPILDKQGRNIRAESVGLVPTEVYCGVNCSDEHIEKIRSISEKTGLLFHRCGLSKTDYMIID